MADPRADAVALTAFEPALADAVVSVLSESGIPAWQADERDSFGDVVVMVPGGRRDEAMAAMGRQMERIAAKAREHGERERASRPAPPPQRDIDDPRSGPPLTMERFTRLRHLVIVVLAPLLVVTIAGPYLSRGIRTVVFTALLIGAVVWLQRRRGGED